MKLFSRKPFKLSHGDSSSFYVILSAVFVLISLACIVAIVRIRSIADTSLSPTQTAQAGNAAPAVDEATPSDATGSGDISLPSSGLLLNEGTTVNLYVRGSVSDSNGCANLDHIDVKAYRSGATGGESCTPDNNDCYAVTIPHGDIVCSGPSDLDAAYEAIMPVQYFADPSDVGSQYEGDTWIALATAYDAGGANGNLAADFEMQSLAAFGLSTESINYGSLSLGATSPQQTVTFSNTGNRLVDAYVNADLNMHSNLAGFADILSTAVHYSLSDGFAYNTGDTAVELTQTLMDLNLEQQTDEVNPTTVPGYFRFKMPASGVNGTYSNILTFTAFATAYLQDTPTINSMSVTSTLVGGETMQVTITGTDFPSNSQVFLGATQLTTVRNSSESLTITILSSQLQEAGSTPLTVVNPSTNNTSAPVNFLVLNYPPRFTGISPTTKTQYSGEFTLTLNGDDLTPTSQVKIDGDDVATTYVSRTQLTAVIPSSYVDAVGDHSITITNPAPGGGTSVTQTLTVHNADPMLSSISPSSKTIGDAQFTMTLTGTGFNSNSQAKLGGSNRTTSFVSPTQLNVTIPATDMADVGTASITVENPAPGGGTSAGQTFTVNNPAPTLSSISPSSKNKDDAQFSMTLTGTGFSSNSQAKLDGSNRTTAYVSPTQLTVTIPATDMASAGTYDITVVNPAPGGGTSGVQTFTVNNPAPTLGSISPSSKNARDAQFTMTLTGTNFQSNSQVQLGGSDRATTYVSPTSLTAVIPATDMASGGSLNITVVNPAPGGGTSGAQVLTVSNPVPSLSNLGSTSKTVGSAQFTQVLDGSNFVPTSQVQVDGVNRDTTYVTANRLSIVVPASDMTTTVVYNYTVVNPAPGGGTSAVRTFTVTNPAPTLNSIAPASKYVNNPEFTLTLTGTGFAPGSIVRANGSDRATTYISSTQITAIILASDLAASGLVPITVFNPAPGGGTSAIRYITVQVERPTLGSVSPNTKTVGSAQFTMTFTGTKFAPDSQAVLESNNLATTYVSATQLTAIVPASAMTAPGTFYVWVSNQGLNSLQSITFTVN
ncbi:MAG: IPT/TIG domain-containing protein [Patescibacteria group bacterium]